MSIITVLYLISLISNLTGAIGMVLFIYILLIIATLIGCGYCDGDDKAFARAKAISLSVWNKLPIIIGLFIFSLFLPSEKEMYLMIGSSYLDKSELPVKVQKALELKLDNIISDLQKEKK